MQHARCKLRGMNHLFCYTACSLELALRGVFAGNIFDLGAEASAQQYAAGGSAFATTRDQVRVGCGCSGGGGAGGVVRDQVQQSVR